MPKNVLMLLANGFELLEAAAFTDVLGWADADGAERITLLTAGLTTPVRTTFGFAAVPGALTGDLDLAGFDALVIPGGFASAGFFDEALSPPFLDVIRAFAGRDAPVAAVCVSSLALAAAGLLAGRAATTYHQAGGKRRAELEAHGVRFVDAAIVTDGAFITSTGPGTAIEVALALLASLTTPENAAHVRARMRIPMPDPAWFTTPQVAP